MTSKLTTQGSRDNTAKNNLDALTTSLEIAEDGDSGREIGKRVSKTWRRKQETENLNIANPKT
jgi:hypothetical protein